jgi:hypothetical protein
MFMSCLESYKLYFHIQGEHRLTLILSNVTENKYGVRRTSHSHQSIETLSKLCFKWPGRCCCCCTPPLCVTSFENGYPTRWELVCSALGKVSLCNSSAPYISHSFSRLGGFHPTLSTLFHSVVIGFHPSFTREETGYNSCNKMWTVWLYLKQ